MRQMARKRTQTELLSLVDILEPLSNEELEDVAAHCPGIHLKRGADLYYPEKHHGGLCLFWLLVSVVLSVTLTVVVNLVLFVLSG